MGEVSGRTVGRQPVFSHERRARDRRDLWVRRVRSGAVAGNDDSTRLYEKLGFRREAELAGSYF